MFFRRLRRDTRGTTLIEYGLLVSLVALVSSFFVGQFGQKLIGVFNYLIGFLPA